MEVGTHRPVEVVDPLVEGGGSSIVSAEGRRVVIA